ncbi:MAG: DUF559 domain-containing protein [Novosphingobium sp.]|nr:DUF559 domain-containing protein [Novosphingobium sp.]
MWQLLREFYPHARWRREVPIRHFIVDFISHRYKLAIEVDGGQHDADKDAQRSAMIEKEGYRVVRFWNNEVLTNGEGCMIRLGQLVSHDHPLPTSTRRSSNAKSAYPSPIEGEEES